MAEYIIWFILGATLIINCVTDIRRMEVHDLAILCGGALCLVVRLFSPELWPATFAGAVFGFLTGLLLFLWGMGFGDVKLLALIGGCLGAGICLVALTAAGVCASLYGLFYLKLIRKKNLKTELPFVPFLTLGCTAALAMQSQLEVFF